MTPTVSSRRRACPACVKSKVRCQGTDGGICDRCARLSLPCSLPNSHGSPGATSHQPQRKDRIDRIQEQLDAIVAQLAETRGARPVSPPHTSATPDEVEVASSEAPTGDIFQRGVIDEDDGERLIQKFRSHKMPLFPFVVIAQEETLASLRKNSPFLLVAIAGVCLEDRPKLQRLFDAEVRNEVAKRVIVQGERNMDILLGLLVHLAWHQYHWEHFPSQMFMYLQMVGCLLGDMGLDGEVAYTMPAGYPSVSRLDKTVLPARHQRTAAGMRAVLGCYYLCSINSIFRKNIAMKLTPQLREYCNHLYAHPEHPTDTLLGAFVDSQSLSRGIEEMVLQRKALVWDSLSTTIEDACTKIKTKFTKHGLYTHGASFVEFKAMQAFAGICYLRYLRRNLEPSDLVSVQAIFRSAKAAITAFLELPDSTVVHLPGPSFLTVWYCLLIMAKLTMLAPQNALGDIDALGRSQTRQVTLAVVNRLQLFSRGEDWWATSARMAQLVPWLEEYTPGAGTREATVTMPCPSDGPTPADRSTCCDTVDRSASYEPCAHVATTEAVPPETTTAAALESCYTPLQPSGEHELDGLLWDEPVWQQMIADFAQHPNAWVFDLGGANTPL